MPLLSLASVYQKIDDRPDERASYVRILSSKIRKQNLIYFDIFNFLWSLPMFSSTTCSLPPF
jgi:hypothetical protein